MATSDDFASGYGPWTAETGWTYAAFENAVPADRLGLFADFKRLWDSKRVEGRVPLWRDFDLTDFKPWWGYLCLEEIIPGDEYDTVFKLWGTNLVRMLDVELTGRSLRSTFDSAYSDYEIRLFERIRDQNILVASHGPVYWRKSQIWDHSSHVAFFQIPVSSDGAKSDMVLSLVQAVKDDTVLPQAG